MLNISITFPSPLANSQVCLSVCKYKHLFPIDINNISVQGRVIRRIIPKLGIFLPLFRDIKVIFFNFYCYFYFFVLFFFFFVAVQHICNYMTCNFLLLSMTATFLTFMAKTCLIWCLYHSKIIVNSPQYGLLKLVYPQFGSSEK